MKTLITGASGLIGSALVEYLFQQGHSIQCLKRNPHNKNTPFWAIQSLPDNSDAVFSAVIHLAGENVAQGRWTAAKKKRILQSRVDGTRELVDYISLLPVKPDVFLTASAIGFYGNRGDDLISENSPGGEGFLADVCRQWEQETKRLTTMNIRVVTLRFGMVLSPKGGALHKMIPPFKANLGGTIGSGKQYISWISIRDLVQIVDFIINNKQISGPVNIVSPIQTTNGELTKILGRALGSRPFLKIPAFVVKLIFGQMAKEMLLSSTRVTPTVLLENDYTFRDQSLAAVISHCTK